eukprot:837211-Pyramimonas_sp.AAC.1
MRAAALGQLNFALASVLVADTLPLDRLFHHEAGARHDARYRYTFNSSNTVVVGSVWVPALLPPGTPSTQTKPKTKANQQMLETR